MNNFIRKRGFGPLILIVLASLSILSGCAHSGGPHPFRSQQGLLAPLEDPDSLVSDPSSLSLYLGDLFNARGEGGTVLFGHRLASKLRAVEGEQVASVCRSIPCYADAARKLHYKFILAATIQKDVTKGGSEEILTLTRWSVDPLFPEVTVPVTFSMKGQAPSYEKLVERGVSRMMRRVEALSSRKNVAGPEGAAKKIRKLVAEGKVDLALRQGEAIFKNGSSPPHSIEFYSTLYRLEMSAGKPEMARRVGEEAIRLRRASSDLFLEMARNARDAGELNRERNILFEGLSQYPEDRFFWRELVDDSIDKGDFSQAFKIIHIFNKRNGSSPAQPSFRWEVYACLVGLDRGDEADLWYRRYILKHKVGEVLPKPFMAHAMVIRELQKGEWKKAEMKARDYIAMGVRSRTLYTDWMIAMGADNNPIGEAHAARLAISAGFSSRWIRDQLAYLEQKGY